MLLLFHRKVSSLSLEGVVPASKEIVRAICTDKWNGVRLSPSLFKEENTSVSRLALIPLRDHWAMFRYHVEKPLQRKLEKIAQINVAVLRQIGQDHTKPTAPTMVPKPEDWNSAYAEIPQKSLAA